ncbi:MAG: cyanase, partial [Alphaproteobacteria bacterium]
MKEDPMIRAELIEKIVAAKIHSGIKWSEIAEAVGQSKEWTTAALMGQVSMTKEEATNAGKMLNLSEDDVTLLQVVPSRGSLTEDVPKDPLIYRFYEVVHV